MDPLRLVTLAPCDSVGMDAAFQYEFIGYAPLRISLCKLRPHMQTGQLVVRRCVSRAVAGVDEAGRPNEAYHEMPEGNPQPYILWQAEEACRNSSNAAAEHFIAKMDDVLDQRSNSLTRTNISTMFHRCAKVMNATIQASTLNPHIPACDRPTLTLTMSVGIPRR